MSRHAFDHTIQHFINRPVVTPDDRMWLKRVGVPSGSYYTQLVDSIANLIATYYARETATLLRLALCPELPVSGPAMSLNRIYMIKLDGVKIIILYLHLPT